ncbi:MAG: SIS domain-containing protein [Microscillaceae bacterium]|nr:SIS domain-containing protein [Microscillaceae bacterium]
MKQSSNPNKAMTMYDLILGFPEQLQKALALSAQIKTSTPKAEIRNVLVGGLGGSGIGASIVESLLASHLKVPYSITKTYEVPAFVDAHTLFIASTFSGNTEETLAALEEARQREAHIFASLRGAKPWPWPSKQAMTLCKCPMRLPVPGLFGLLTGAIAPYPSLIWPDRCASWR